MKPNTKKIIFLTIGTTILTASIVTPVVILNQEDDQKNQDKKDVNKIVKILEEKNDKTIVLSGDSTGKIIADNQEKIITKLKKIIGSENLKEIKIEISMQNDNNISNTPQKIIIKLTKNKILKEIKDFLVKKDFTTNEDIVAIKNILDSKTGNDLIITLSSNSTGRIVDINNKNAIEKKIRILVDPSNTNGEANHQSLMGTTISVSINTNAPISTTPQDIIVSISKTGGTTLTTTKTFLVKRNFTNAEKITNYFANNAKKEITISGGEDLNTEAKILAAIKKHLASDDGALWTNQLQILITTHSSETTTSIIKNEPVITIYSIAYDDDSNNAQKIDLTINHVSTNAEKITNYFASNGKKNITISGEDLLDTKIKILVAIRNHLASDESDLWTSELQSLITTHSSETKTSIVKDGPTITYSIAYNDDLDNIQKVDLAINYVSYTNAQKITNYFANSSKKIFTIFGGETLNTEAKILAAIRNHLASDDGALWTNQLQSLITTHNSETTTSIVKNEPAIKIYSIAYDDDSNNAQKIDLVINHVSTNAEKITNYFASNGKKNITISGEDLLDTKIKILTAIRNHLASDESALWTSKLQSLITTHSSETETSIVKDGPTITYSIAYNDDLDNIQKVDLAINYVSYTNAQKITNYFANSSKKIFTIFGGETLNTEAKILAAIKKHLASDESALWTNQLQSLITTHSSETKTSIIKNEPAITYSIAYNDDLGNIQKVELLINQIYYTNAEKITNYFASNGKKNITIFGDDLPNTKTKILAAIRDHLTSDESDLWTSELQSLITTHSSETKTSIAKNRLTIYSIAYNDDLGNIQKVDLTIVHVSET